MVKIEDVLESLSQAERQILPHINERTIEKIAKKTGLDQTAIIRAVQFLENKKLVTKDVIKKKIIDWSEKGQKYLTEGLPERKLLNLMDKKRKGEFQKIKEESGLDGQEFSASLGVLKNKGLIIVEKGMITIEEKEEARERMTEEELLEKLPVSSQDLTAGEKEACEKLQARGILQIKEINDYEIKLTTLGEDIERCSVDSTYDNMIEQVTPQIINNEEWKLRKFRRYDVTSRVPEISGGKKHFVREAVEYGKEIWKEMGFVEMSGGMVQTTFWNFDALFTAQDHPVREMQDTFYIKGLRAKLPDKKIVQAVKNSHEGKVGGSKGWGGQWDEEEAKKVLLRTQTTGLSAKMLARLGRLRAEEKKGKYFAIGMNFRNETVDWNHGFQFNQTEGIVIGKGLNFQNLLGYLQEFFKKMGYEKVRFRPSYFPYTEPSVEIDVWYPQKGIWRELGGAGMFRPEVTIPLLGEHIPVLAWGPGFDRSMTEYYKIGDLRELYSNDLTKLRQKKKWMK
jgi:phenylalanyl-tRNA synthetase alpha chain